MRVLVTGSAGFIGRATCYRLFESTEHVVCSMLDRHRAAIAPPFRDDVLDVRSDVLPALFEELRPDAVIHLAAQTSLQASWEDAWEDMAENIGGTVAVLQAMKVVGCPRIVLASTSAVYAPFNLGRYMVDDLTEPIVPYGVSKLAAENYCRVLAPEAVILRYGNVYGPHQKPLGENILIARAIEHLKGRLPDFRINGDGEQVRDWVYVEDVARANVLALTMAPGTYNIGGTPASVNDVLRVLGEVWKAQGGPATDFDHGPAKPGELERVVLDGLEAKRAGYIPEVGLTDGLRRTLEAA